MNQARPDWIYGTRWLADMLMCFGVLNERPRTLAVRVAEALATSRKYLEDQQVEVLKAEQELAVARAMLSAAQAEVKRLEGFQRKGRVSEIKNIHAVFGAKEGTS